MSEIRTETARSVDLPLGPGRETLRITLTDQALILAPGFGGAETGSPFHRPCWHSSPLRIPAGKAPALVEALSTLIEADR